MDKIRVMNIISDTNFGGAGRYVLDICEYIDKDRFQIIVVIPIDSIIKEHIKGYEDIEVIEIEGIGDQSFSIKGVIELYSLMKKTQVDIVHCHACLSGRVAAYLSKIKGIIYTRHSLVNCNSGIKRYVNKIINNILKNDVIAVSQAVYNNLIKCGEKRNNIHLIYNGVNLPSKALDTKKLRSKYGLSAEDIIITLVGRLEPIKGQEHLLNIAKILKKRIRGFQIVLVGEGSTRGKLESQISKDNLAVKILGHINNIDEIYSLTDIVVNTSNSEAISFSILEGFSHKNPVVAFDIDGIKEVVNDGINGYLVEFRDYDDFASKLIKLINDKNLRNSFGKAGFKKVEGNFPVENMIKQIEDIYGGLE